MRVEVQNPLGFGAERKKKRRKVEKWAVLPVA
jgi:hypothetical protein